METATKVLGRWTADELLDEVLTRHATDRATLQLLESKILSARLAEIDDKFAKKRDYSELLP
jgi:hypothetical protein